MLAAMQARGRGLQPILGRRLNGAQLAASIGQLVATLDAFVVAKDARSATALLDAFSRQLDGVAALIAGV